MKGSFNLNNIDITSTLNDSINIISAYGHGYIVVKNSRNEGNLVVTASEICKYNNFDDIQKYISERDGKIIIFGSNDEEEREDFRKFSHTIDNHDISFEIMSLSSAIRTYNVLVSDGRNTISILMLGEKC